MKPAILVMFLACAPATVAAELPSSNKSPTIPRYASKPLVENYYPATSRSAKEQGTTKLNLCYDDQGRPTQVTVKEGSGLARLDEAALRWGKAVRMSPGIFGGRPRPGCVSMPVVFSLEKSLEPQYQGEPMMIELPPTFIMPPPPPPPPPGKFIPL